ncbi:MAG: Bacteriocin class IId cyclical uberolysin-like [Bacillota bacterium]|jgi:circularin A/uberolysin family circular bacteriocin
MTGKWIADLIDAGTTVHTIIMILTTLSTGVGGLMANAGRLTLMAYLKRELRRRGRRAFIAW